MATEYKISSHRDIAAMGGRRRMGHKYEGEKRGGKGGLSGLLNPHSSMRRGGGVYGQSR